MSETKEPRRRFLRQVFAIVPAATVASGATLGAAACTSHAADHAAPAARADYHPSYFTADEWRFINAAVDKLIPADALGPGALQAGVPEFIDRQMDTPYGHGKLWYMQGPFHPDQAPEMGYQMSLAPRDMYRHGIKACNDFCVRQFGGKSFADLDADTQVKVLGDLEHGKITLEPVPAKTFFSYLLNNAKEGFLSDPIYGGNRDMVGWKMVGFTGARADFMDWIEQPGAKYPYGPVSIDGSRG
ncbi:gluconate 2-dehydrogenase subunit 3 family protein [Chitinasiproducens palmae]|uniref:Gluconate 2-dehydrogenase gamma chain n=1 Tax=Chitinasiproducens palmae TaxID=1770053 RepID=A0A1H2PLA4_9BURK|nr:gluconate 2-dehydrogenase subunit 3 family protein [Chitinasiproducens palmae]SDV46428.1 gluconate 2-dehydrogenase gamma chain [Chitinasiproducens palmae]